MIIIYKHGIYHLPHEFPNDLQVRISGNLEKSTNYFNLIEWKPSALSPWQIAGFINTTRKLYTNRNRTIPIVHYFTWKLELVSSILGVIVSANIFLILTCPWPLQA